MPGDNTVAIVAVIVAGSASLAAAAIAAYSAGRRQRRELDAGNERLRLQLDADRQARRDQFEHEHELRDLQELRALLDEVAALAGEIKLAVGELRRSDSVGRVGLRSRIHDRTKALIGAHQRVETRLGGNSAVTRQIHKFLVASRHHYELADRHSDADASDEEWAKAEAAARRALRAYHEEVRRLVGTRVRVDPGPHEASD